MNKVKFIEKKRAFLFNLLILFSFFIITFVWYRNNNWKVLMGDDLIAIGSFQENGFWKTLYNPDNISLGKIRPVSIILLYFVYIICGIEYAKYYFVLRLLLVISIYFVFVLCRKMEIKLPYAYVISLTMLTCPFSAYGVWQALGILEIFSLLCCVCCLYFQYKIIGCCIQKKIYYNVIYCSIIFALLIFNAERFMYLVAVFELVVLLNKYLTIKEKGFLSIIYFLPIIARSVLLHAVGASAVGTGRGSILALFSTLGAYTLKAFVNMLGFSLGDQWHGGFTLYDLPLVILIISSLRVFIFIGIAFNVLVNFIKKENSRNNFEVIVMYVFSITSLFSYALVGATHGEDRFLWVPYVYYLLALGKYVSNSKPEKIYIWQSTIVLITILASNYYYIVNKIHVHFRYSQEMAQTCIDSINNIENWNLVENVCCINSRDYFWVFGDQYFFKMYVNENLNTYYYDTFEDIDSYINKEDTLLVFPDADHLIPYGAKACWFTDYMQEY